LANSKGQQVPQRAEPSSLQVGLVSKFLHAKQRMGATASARESLTYRGWCATRIQAWWRMCPVRRAWLARGWSPFFVAARSVQRWWLELMLNRVIVGRGLGDDPRRIAARRIQHCWRGFSSRRIMRYYVDLIKFREQGSPAQLLRSINPREAGLLDAATGAHVRFRLGGLDWPPKVYYKIYTHASVTDICAFAPRDYTREKQLAPRALHNHPSPAGEQPGGGGPVVRRSAPSTREGWYRRVENNGWRPVQESLLREVDFVTLSTAAKPLAFAPTKTQRREEQMQRRRQRKIEWLRRMYRDKGGGGGGGGGNGGAEGTAGSAGGGIGGLGSGAGGYSGGDDEDVLDVDGLLQWTDELDFDGYYNNWLTLATTSRSKPPGLADLDYEDDGDEDPYELEEEEASARVPGYLVEARG
jgi:hypothetical protein